MNKQSCFARMLDIRGFVIALRNTFYKQPPGATMLLVVGLTIIAVLIAPLWVTYDLASTWYFTTDLRNTAEPIINEAAARSGDMLGTAFATMLAGLILTGFTLLPSLFEIVFPSINHPLVNLVLQASIVFDYVTDWPKAVEVTATWTENPIPHFLYATLFCLAVSVGLQAILVLCLTSIIFGTLAILINARAGQSVQQ